MTTLDVCDMTSKVVDDQFFFLAPKGTVISTSDAIAQFSYERPQKPIWLLRNSFICEITFLSEFFDERNAEGQMMDDGSLRILDLSKNRIGYSWNAWQYILELLRILAARDGLMDSDEEW